MRATLTPAVSGFGDLAGRAEAEAEGGTEDYEPGDGDQEVHQVDEQALVEEGGADHGNVREQGDGDLLEARYARGGPARAEDLNHQEPRTAKGEQDDGGAGDNLIRLEGDTRPARGSGRRARRDAEAKTHQGTPREVSSTTPAKAEIHIRPSSPMF